VHRIRTYTKSTGEELEHAKYGVYEDFDCSTVYHITGGCDISSTEVTGIKQLHSLVVAGTITYNGVLPACKRACSVRAVAAMTGRGVNGISRVLHRDLDRAGRPAPNKINWTDDVVAAVVQFVESANREGGCYLHGIQTFLADQHDCRVSTSSIRVLLKT